jgi:hypothetical protein
MLTHFAQLPLPQLEQEKSDYIDRLLAPFFILKHKELLKEGVVFHCYLVTEVKDGYKVELYVDDKIYTVKIKPSV